MMVWSSGLSVCLSICKHISTGSSVKRGVRAVAAAVHAGTCVCREALPEQCHDRMSMYVSVCCRYRGIRVGRVFGMLCGFPYVSASLRMPIVYFLLHPTSVALVGAPTQSV